MPYFNLMDLNNLKITKSPYLITLEIIKIFIKK
jgi:hypothetical protein